MRPNTTEAKDLNVKETAKLIRANLKQFKGVKFSVRSERGGSIRIVYYDGPAKNEVEKVAKIGGKGFDGMIDLAYYKYHWFNPKTGDIKYAGTKGTLQNGGSEPEVWHEKPSQDYELVSIDAGYVFIERKFTEDGANKISKKFAEKYGLRDKMTVEPFMSEFEVYFKNFGDKDEFYRYANETSL